MREPSGEVAMATAPRVSVCIPSYNYAHYLPDAVGSVLAQTYTDYELVIVDNCSKDNTEEIVAGFVRSGVPLRFHRNDRNLGQAGNFNRCIELSGGRYVQILCADDLLEPTCLEKLSAALDGHPSASLAGSARVLVDERLSPVRVLAYSDRYAEEPGHDVILRCLLNGNLIGEPSSVMFRKEHAVRGFTDKYRQLIDMEMWFHLLEQGDFVFLPEPLSKFRKHGGQQTLENLKDPSFFDDGWRIFSEYIDRDYIRMSRARKEFLKIVRRGGMTLLRNSHLLRYAFSVMRSKVTARSHHV
jgi:glycosyltransferase involved in cell wall biosynthesis